MTLTADTLQGLDHHLAQITRCPLTGQRLRVLRGDALAHLGGAETGGAYHYLDGTPRAVPLPAALVTADDSLAYPLDDDIAHLLPEYAIPLTAARRAQPLPQTYQPSVRAFYDGAGWQEDASGATEDARRYEDLRPVAADYVHRGHLRINDHIAPRGTYLLDVASGPIQYPGYLTWSAGYAVRVCMDISRVALERAREKLSPGRGLYILGSIANLPLATGSMDAVVSLHTVYHIPRDGQRAVFDELHRVLRPGGRAVVVYTWANIAPLSRPAWWLNRWKHVSSPEAEFFYDPHPARWFYAQAWPYPFAILAWRSVSVTSLRLFVHARWGGRALLRAIFWLEGRFPRTLARLGQYPMFVITKTPPGIEAPG